MFTRKDYLKGKCTHREYYAQFVDEPLRHYVQLSVGFDVICNSTEPAFADVPLYRWERTVESCNRHASYRLTEAGDFQSMATGVCIAKEAAQQIKDRADAPHAFGT